MSSSYLRIYRQTPRFTSCTWRWRVRGASWWRRCRSAKQSWPGRTGTWLTWGVRGSSRSTGWTQHCCLTNTWCLFQRGKDYSALQKYSCHLTYKRQSFHWDLNVTDQHLHFIACFFKMKGERRFLFRPPWLVLYKAIFYCSYSCNSLCSISSSFAHPKTKMVKW